MNKYINVIYNTIRLIGQVLYYGYFNPNIYKIKLKDYDKSCYIIGNGPSLNSDLEKIKNYIKDSSIFVVNDFASSNYYNDLKPAYYVLVDPCYWEQNVTEIYKTICSNSLISIKNNTTWPLKLITTYKGAKFLREYFASNKNITIYYYNHFVFETNTKLDYFFYSNFFAAPHIQNVLLAAIMAGITIGFKEVNILGADHSWTEDMRVNAYNQVCLRDRHFYDDKLAQLSPVLKLDGNVFTMHEILDTYSKMFYGYHIISKYALFKKVDVFNYTEQSYIDAFERKTL